MKQRSVFALGLAFLSSMGAAQDSATLDLSDAALGQGAAYLDDNIRLAASSSGTALFSVPAKFPSNSKDGDAIHIAVNLEISNPGEGFNPRSGKAPKSGLKSSQLCQLTVTLGSTAVWVGQLLPTYKVLQIGSKHTFNYTSTVGDIALSFQQSCPDPASEFLVHGAKLLIGEPIIDNGDSTSTGFATATATGVVATAEAVQLSASTTSSSAESTSSDSAATSLMSASSLGVYGGLAAWFMLNYV